MLVVSAVDFFPAVFPVTEQWPSRMGHLDADLMCAAGKQAAFDKRQVSGFL